MSTNRPLRDLWPKQGMPVEPTSPVGLTPAHAPEADPEVGDTWFSEDGHDVYYWTGTEPILIFRQRTN